MHVLWAAMSSSTTTGPHGIRRAQQRLAALADHGSHTLLLGSAKSIAATTQLGDETIHTTANHPWLSADRGWIVAGHLQLGEPVQRVDGSTAEVVALTTVHGSAPMWDLTVSNVHDFAVGDGAYVVHNCGRTGRVYEPSVKHAKGGWGSPMDLDNETAQKVLTEGVEHPNGNSVWNVHKKGLYVFRRTNEVLNTWHGYRVLEGDFNRAQQQAGGRLWREMIRRGLHAR